MFAVAVASRNSAIADSDFSPLADRAAVQMVVTSEGLSIFRSFTAVTAVREALQLAVLRLSDQSLNRRLEAASALFEEFDTYCVQPQKALQRARAGIKKAHR